MDTTLASPPTHDILQTVYNPPKQKSTTFCFEKFVGHDQVRYHSYGRHSFYQALKYLGVQEGDNVLLPGFICRDVLSAIHTLGATPLFYEVTKELQLSIGSHELPVAKAIVAVNYFGFVQNLKPFFDYCKKNDVRLIEDNCHGFLSYDETGKPLGTRGDVGIFSLRKTLPIPNGAALVVNTFNNVLPEVESRFSKRSFGFLVKKYLRQCVPIVGIWPIRVLRLLIRLYRKLLTGSELPLPNQEDQTLMPSDPAPSQELFDYMPIIDIEQEKSRRRELYHFVGRLLHGVGVEPVFNVLPKGVVPYVYPFYFLGDNINSIKKLLNKFCLDCYPWPDLPDEIIPVAPEHYKKIWMVTFLW